MHNTNNQQKNKSSLGKCSSSHGQTFPWRIQPQTNLAKKDAMPLEDFKDYLARKARL
jgi:hypothetical protein